jgi:hypothetical protein
MLLRLVIRGPISTYCCKLTPFTVRSVVCPSIYSGHTNEMRSCSCCDQMYSYKPGFGYGLDNWGIVVRFQAGAQFVSSPNSPHSLREAVLQESKQPNCAGDRSLTSGNQLNNAMAPLTHAPSWAVQGKLYFHQGGIYDQQDATNLQYFIVINALHVSGHHRPSSGARNCVCSHTVCEL